MLCRWSANSKWSKSFSSLSGCSKALRPKVSAGAACRWKPTINRRHRFGGDYGLVIPGDGRLDVVVCDVSGHGISSALVANRIYSETMSQIERGADLGSMLRHLNHFAVQNLASSSFYFTLAAVRFHQSRGCLQFAGAGHPPAIVIRRGQSPSLLESTCMILGLF